MSTHEAVLQTGYFKKATVTGSLSWGDGVTRACRERFATIPSVALEFGHGDVSFRPLKPLKIEILSFSRLRAGDTLSSGFAQTPGSAKAFSTTTLFAANGIGSSSPAFSALIMQYNALLANTPGTILSVHLPADGEGIQRRFLAYVSHPSGTAIYLGITAICRTGSE